MEMDCKFKVGDRVVATAPADYDFYFPIVGALGVVEIVEEDTGHYQVTFEGGRGWWFMDKDDGAVELYKPKKKKAPKGKQQYKGNGKHTWEHVATGSNSEDMERLRVPGGWLYRDEHTLTVTFVPMPEVVDYAI
jgi:hypothetical protein